MEDRLDTGPLCDADGVPRLIQRMVYNYGCFWIEVTAFDGSKFTMEPPDCVGLLCRELSTMQWLECERDAERAWHMRRGHPVEVK